MNALAGFIFNIIGFINYVLVPLIFAIAFLVFIWGVVQYFIIGGAQDEARAKGRSFIMWGIIGFVVMISLWGLVNMLVNTLGFNNQARPALPTFGSPSQYGGFGGYGNNGGAGGGSGVPGGGSSCSGIIFQCSHMPEGYTCENGMCVCRSAECGQGGGSGAGLP